jgi:hypothetical protein
MGQACSKHGDKKRVEYFTVFLFDILLLTVKTSKSIILPVILCGCEILSLKIIRHSSLCSFLLSLSSDDTYTNTNICLLNRFI